jgi:hypothetical protein
VSIFTLLAIAGVVTYGATIAHLLFLGYRLRRVLHGLPALLVAGVVGSFLVLFGALATVVLLVVARASVEQRNTVWIVVLSGVVLWPLVIEAGWWRWWLSVPPSLKKRLPAGRTPKSIE